MHKGKHARCSKILFILDLFYLLTVKSCSIALFHFTAAGTAGRVKLVNKLMVCVPD